MKEFIETKFQKELRITLRNLWFKKVRFIRIHYGEFPSKQEYLDGFLDGLNTVADSGGVERIDKPDHT